MDIEYKVCSGLAIFARRLFDTLNIGQYVACFLFSACNIFSFAEFQQLVLIILCIYLI